MIARRSEAGKRSAARRRQQGAEQPVEQGAEQPVEQGAEQGVEQSVQHAPPRDERAASEKRTRLDDNRADLEGKSEIDHAHASNERRSGAQEKRRSGTMPRQQDAEQVLNRTPIYAEAEAEAEAEADLVVADVVTSHQVPDARGGTIDDDLIRIVARVIGEHTAVPVPAGHAAAVARQLLAGRDVTDPAAYVAAAIRADPRRYLPVAVPPPSDHAEQRERARSRGAGPPPPGLLDGLRRQLSAGDQP
jgi:hypothetical protein